MKKGIIGDLTIFLKYVFIILVIISILIGFGYVNPTDNFTKNSMDKFAANSFLEIILWCVILLVIYFYTKSI